MTKPARRWGDRQVKKWRRASFVLSGLLVVAGVGALYERGKTHTDTEGVISDSLLSMRIDSASVVIGDTRAAIAIVVLRVNAANDERERIICLVTLTATGRTLTPLQVESLCP